MPQVPNNDYRCPQCGHTVALFLPTVDPRSREVTVRCLQCAHATRLIRPVSPADRSDVSAD